MSDLLFDDPFDWFEAWLGDAERAGVTDHNAMTLATVDGQGRPSARTVLLKDYSPAGFVFYTNTRSRKGQELAANPQACLLFHWRPLYRQIRIAGAAELVSDDEADKYFPTRPRISRLGAWASLQSEPLADRQTLERRLEELSAKWPGDEIPRPAHWSGYRVIPREIEFWSAGDFRLHDRWEFRRDDVAADWKASRLYP